METPRPPRLARRILEWALPTDVRGEIAGDLDEVFRTRRENLGRIRAHLWYWGQVLSFSRMRFRLERVGT